MDGEGVGIDVEEAILEVSYPFNLRTMADVRQMMMMRLMVLWSTTPFTVGDRYVLLSHFLQHRYRSPMATLEAPGLNKSSFSSTTTSSRHRPTVWIDDSASEVFGGAGHHPQGRADVVGPVPPISRFRRQRRRRTKSPIPVQSLPQVRPFHPNHKIEANKKATDSSPP
jgi:hypothetical protein